MNLELTDKIAIVTGSSKGLGLASARALVAEGCRVTICARGETKLHESADELRRVAESSDRVIAVTDDLSPAGGVETGFQRTADAFGGLDILVNNVGVAKGAGIADTSDAEWQEAFDQPPFPDARAARPPGPPRRP